MIDRSAAGGSRLGRARALPGSRGSRGRAGFTLVDVLVAAVILVVAVLGLLATIVTSRDLEKSTQTWSARVRLVNDAAERLRNGDLATRVTEFRAAPKLSEYGQSVTVQFPVATLTTDLASYSCPTSPFLDVDKDGQLDVVAANAGKPGLLPVRLSVANGKSSTVHEFLVANR